MSRTQINEQVIVTAFGFRKNLVAYPRRIEFRGVTYYFLDAGLRCMVRHGSRIAQILTLSDGQADYCLRSDNDTNKWTLLCIVR